MSVCISIVSAVLLWTLTEYLMHRFNGHGLRGRTEFSRDHLAHHASLEYFTPARSKLKRAVLVSCFLFPISILALGNLLGLVFAATYLAAYAYYDYLHQYSHSHPPRTKYGRCVRKHHFIHHFSHPKHNFGVTTLFWDRVFGTLVNVDVVKVPQRRAMVWLCHPVESGSVRAFL